MNSKHRENERSSTLTRVYNIKARLKVEAHLMTTSFSTVRILCVNPLFTTRGPLEQRMHL